MESTKFVVRQERASAGNSFGFGDSLLKMKMLQAM
jgi:hypothetical protein